MRVIYTAFMSIIISTQSFAQSIDDTVIYMLFGLEYNGDSKNVSRSVHGDKYNYEGKRYDENNLSVRVSVNNNHKYEYKVEFSNVENCIMSMKFDFELEGRSDIYSAKIEIDMRDAFSVRVDEIDKQTKIIGVRYHCESNSLINICEQNIDPFVNFGEGVRVENAYIYYRDKFCPKKAF